MLLLIKKNIEDDTRGSRSKQADNNHDQACKDHSVNFCSPGSIVDRLTWKRVKRSTVILRAGHYSLILVPRPACPS